MSKKKCLNNSTRSQRGSVNGQQQIRIRTPFEQMNTYERWILDVNFWLLLFWSLVCMAERLKFIVEPSCIGNSDSNEWANGHVITLDCTCRLDIFIVEHINQTRWALNKNSNTNGAVLAMCGQQNRIKTRKIRVTKFINRKPEHIRSYQIPI